MLHKVSLHALKTNKQAHKQYDLEMLDNDECLETRFKWIAGDSLCKQPCKRTIWMWIYLQHPFLHPPPPRSWDAGKAQPASHCFNAKQMLVPGVKQLKRINFLSVFRERKKQYIFYLLKYNYMCFPGLYKSVLLRLLFIIWLIIV